MTKPTLLIFLMLLGNILTAQDYTMQVSSEIDDKYSLCQFVVVSLGSNSTTAIAMAEMQEEFEGVTSLTSKNGITVTWHPKEGGGTVKMETEFRNKFWMKAGFCYWTEGHEEKVYKEITGDMEGGSENEQELEGPYDTYLYILIDLCGEDIRFSEVERLLSVIDKAASIDPDAITHFEEFDSESHAETAKIWYKVVNYEKSHRYIGEALLKAFGPQHQVKAVYGNRQLYIGDCDKSGLWYEVLKTEEAEGWGESYTGFRVVVAPGRDGNAFVTYGASINTALINIYGSFEPGKMSIQAVPESGSKAYWKKPFITIMKGENMEGTDLVRSQGGTLTLTEGTVPNTMSGHFEMIGVDQLGRRRTVVGGFRNLKFP